MVIDSGDMREHLAGVLQLCEYVLDANTLTDIALLKAKAKQVREEAISITHLCREAYQ